MLSCRPALIYGDCYIKTSIDTDYDDILCRRELSEGCCEHFEAHQCMRTIECLHSRTAASEVKRCSIVECQYHAAYGDETTSMQVQRVSQSYISATAQRKTGRHYRETNANQTRNDEYCCE